MNSLAALATLLALCAAVEDSAPPRSTDPRIVIERFAAEPDIVTPAGIAVDARGRVLVVESHTHFRPADYAGPPADRIRALEDTNGDGVADRVTNFYEGGNATMNVAVYEDGSVFVATRNDVARLVDDNNDGIADRHDVIVRLDTKGNYPHNGISGFAFDALGNVVFGLGENLGAEYRLIGADGTTLAGGGEGGSVYRCRYDGTKLARVATGFWNPFHLCYDAFDRLFVVDNDPDSRPPCRLLHIVDGGDYGYRYRNGRKGVHPFTAWNGELPGTLPMTAGTGEAPSGVIAYESDMLPAEYFGALLVTSWGDHRIDRFRLEPRGASFRAVAEPIIPGGENFRPVGIALAADGSLYVSDWVDKSYDLHGKGAVWRIRATNPVAVARPEDPKQALASRHRPLRQWAARTLADPDERSAELIAANHKFLSETATAAADARIRVDALLALARVSGPAGLAAILAAQDPSADVRAVATRLATEDLDLLRKLAAEDSPPLVRAAALRRLRYDADRPLLFAAAQDNDPFLRQAATAALADSTSVPQRIELASAQPSGLRLTAIVLLRQSQDPAARTVIPALLADADATVRFAAVQWVAEERLTEFRDLITTGLSTGATTRGLFESYLAALERLDGVARNVSDEWSGDQYALALVNNPETSAVVRARALRLLPGDDPGLTTERLTALVNAGDLETRLEAVRTLRERPDAANLIQQIAGDLQSPIPLRAEATVGLSHDIPAARELLMVLATQDDAALRHEALRGLRGATLDDAARARLVAWQTRDADPELIARLLEPGKSPPRPDRRDAAAWAALIDGPADAAAGERVFYHPRGPACFRCHEVDGRGGSIGPELSITARTLTLQRLLESLLVPSKEIAPQFATWNVVRADGTTFTGMLVNENPDGTRKFATSQGELITTKLSDIQAMHAQQTSIMPENLCEQLSVQELRDLLAFLRASR